MLKSRMTWVPLFENMYLQTDANAVGVIRTRDLETDLGSLLLQAESITPITNTKQRTPQLEWTLQLWAGWDRGSELANNPQNLISAWVIADGPLRHPEYTTITNFLPSARLTLASRTGATGTGVQSGTISAGLLVKLWGV